MDRSVLAEFEKIKENVQKGMSVPNLNIQLGALNIQFATASDHFRLCSDEEQEEKMSDFLQLQYLYHDIAMSIITRLLEPLELGEASMEIDQYANASEEQNLAQMVEQVAAHAELQVDGNQPDQQKEPLVQPVNVPNPVEMEKMTIPSVDQMPNLVPTTTQQIIQQGYYDWNDESSNEAECASNREVEFPAPPFHVYCAIMEPIFALEQINQVNEKAIDLVLKTLSNASEAARKLKYSLEHDTAVIIAAVQRKLDVTSQSLWNWQLEKGEPTLDGFANFLAKRASMIAPIELGAKPSVSNVCASTSKACTGAIPKQNVPVNKNMVFKDFSGKPEKKRAKTSCPRCSADHYLHRCDLFRKLILSAKIDTIERARLCRNCFSPAHSTADCAKGECKKCKVKHNSLLCPFNDFQRN